jgi:heat shock protein HtpX
MGCVPPPADFFGEGVLATHMGRVSHSIKAALAFAILLSFYLVLVLTAFTLLAAVQVTTVLGNVGALLVITGVSLGVMYVHYRMGVARIVQEMGAQEPIPTGSEELFTRVDRCARAVGIDRPAISIAPIEEPNALALGGPKRGRLILTTRLLETLDGDELDAILAHECVHLKHRDSVVQSLGHAVIRLVGGAVWLIFLLAGYVAGLLAFLVGERPRKAYGEDHQEDALRDSAAIAAMLLMVGLVVVIRLLSRQREFVADAGAVAVTDDVDALASALRKIEAATTPDAPSDAVPSSLFVVGMADAVLGQYFDSHPSVDQRIDRLYERFGDREEPSRSPGKPTSSTEGNVQ